MRFTGNAGSLLHFNKHTLTYGYASTDIHLDILSDFDFYKRGTADGWAHSDAHLPHSNSFQSNLYLYTNLNTHTADCDSYTDQDNNM